MPLKLKIIIGSTRPGRVGPTISKWVEKAAIEHGIFDVEVVDLVDLGLPLLDEAAHPIAQKYAHQHTVRWSKIVHEADAFVFVTPEYNYFAPASLVNAVQILLREWGYKAAGIVSYGGISGGLRAAQTLRQLLGNVNVHALAQVVPVPMFAQFIDEGGVFRGNDASNEGLVKMLDELNRWAAALKSLRPEQESADRRAA